MSSWVLGRNSSQISASRRPITPGNIVMNAGKFQPLRGLHQERRGEAMRAVNAARLAVGEPDGTSDASTCQAETYDNLPPRPIAGTPVALMKGDLGKSHGGCPSG
jgi:hypothetical protein